jgi:DNA-directed RNA polymerase subunit RPC12/RpoP
MIPVSIDNVFIIYIMIWLTLLTVLWIREIWRVKTYSWELSKDRMCICDRCHYTIFLKNRENITRCPKCNQVCFIKKRANR